MRPSSRKPKRSPIKSNTTCRQCPLKRSHSSQLVPGPTQGQRCSSSKRRLKKLIDEYNSTAAPTTHVTNLGFEGKADVGKYSGKLAIKGTANVEYSSSGLNFLAARAKPISNLVSKRLLAPLTWCRRSSRLPRPSTWTVGLEQYGKVKSRYLSLWRR